MSIPGSLNQDSYVRKAERLLTARSWSGLLAAGLRVTLLIFFWQISLMYTTLFATVKSILTVRFLIYCAIPLLSIIPILATRKVFLQVRRPNLPSLGKVMQTAVSPRAIAYALAHIASALAFSYTYHGLNGTGYMSMITGTRRKAMPNAAFVYNVGFAVFLGIRYTLDLIYAQRDHLSFPIVQRPAGATLKARIPTIFMSAFSRPIAWILFYSFLIYPFFSWAGHGVFSTFMGIIVNTKTYHPRLFHFLLPPTLILRTYLATTLCVTAWDMIHATFEVFLTEDWSITSTLPDPFPCLAHALSLGDKPLIQRLAFIELNKRARLDAAWRVSLFADVNKGEGESAWGLIADQCVRAVDDQKAALLPPPKAKAAPPKPAPAPIPVPGLTNARPRRIVVRGVGEALRPRKTTVASFVREERTRWTEDSVEYVRASEEGGVRKAGEGVGEALRNAFTQLFWAIAEFFTRWSLIILSRMLDLDVRDYVAGEVDRAPFVDGDRAILAIQALASLIAASLTEDRYGVVQADVPRVIESLLGCLTTVETWSRKLKVIESGPEQQAHRQALALIDVCRRSCYQIVFAYWDHLPQLKLKEAAKEQLRSFTDLAV